MRIVLDRKNRLPDTLKLFHDHFPVIIISETKRSFEKEKVHQIILDFDDPSFLNSLLSELYKVEINVLQVEGGLKLLKSFIKAKLWDEAIVNTCSKKIDGDIPSPNIEGILTKTMVFDNDVVQFIRNNS